MKRIKRCKCGGILKAQKYYEVLEGEHKFNFLDRVRNGTADKLFIHKCDKCFKYKIYKQPNI